MKMYFAVLWLCAAVVCSSPVPPNTHCASCAQPARALLHRLSHIMGQDGRMKAQDLFAGFNCTEQSTDMIPFTETAAVCQPTAPANFSCLNQRDASFSAPKCLQSIRTDLRYYEQMLSSFNGVTPTKHDLDPVLTATKALMDCLQQSCPHVSAMPALLRWPDWRGSSFDDRLSLCKALKGFHIRAITMNRALGYISSGDHQK